jgi:hypothetical protein
MKRLLLLFLFLAALVIVPFLIWGGAFETVMSPEKLVAVFQSSRDWAWLAGLGLLVVDLFLPVLGTAVMSALAFAQVSTFVESLYARTGSTGLQRAMNEVRDGVDARALEALVGKLVCGHDQNLGHGASGVVGAAGTAGAAGRGQQLLRGMYRLVHSLSIKAKSRVSQSVVRQPLLRPHPGLAPPAQARTHGLRSPFAPAFS